MRIIYLLVCLPFILFSQNMPKMQFVGFAKGDIENARILKYHPRSSSVENYCVLFEGMAFDPFDQWRAEPPEDRPISLNKMYLLISFADQTDTTKPFLARLILEKTVPVCTVCDGGCYQVKEIAVDTVLVPISPDLKRRRYLINIGEFVKDWHLIHISVSATLFRDQEKLYAVSTQRGGWPWCQ